MWREAIKMNKKNIKLAVISTVGLQYNGIANIILSYLQAMDFKGLDVYVVGTIAVEEKIAKKLESYGCKIVYLESRKEKPLKYWNELRKFIKKEKIEVVHVHGNSATMTIDMSAAWLGGAKRRLAHSHNTTCEQKKADKLLRPFFYMLTTDRLACGEEAGKWLYRDRDFTIIKNGRDESLFKYDEKVRTQLRKNYSLEGKTVIGHVGGFLEQKNHAFLVEILRCISDKSDNVSFVLLGDGELKPQIERKVKDYGLMEKTIFTGNVDNVSDWLQVMDGMLLPSLFEGLPLVSIEWQLAGLPSVLSDNIDKECAASDLVSFLSLEDKPEIWADEILRKIAENQRSISSENSIELLRGKGFLLSTNVNKLKEIYIGKRAV